MKGLKAKYLKQGYIYSKNGYTVSYSGGLFNFSSLYNSSRFKTLGEVKKHIKDTLTD